MRQRRRGDRSVAEPSDQREIGGHHGDLSQLRQGNGQGELDGFSKLDRDRTSGRDPG